MGKRKTAAKESEHYDNSQVTRVNGHMPKTSQSTRPKSSCSTALASIILVAVLSIIIGLIFIELNKSNKDLIDSLQQYHSTKDKKALDDVEVPVLKAKDTLQRPPLPSTPPPSARDKERTEKDTKKSEEKPKTPAMDTVREPTPKKIKKDESSESSVSTDEKKKDLEKRQEEIEKQIVSDKPKKTDDIKTNVSDQEKEKLTEKHPSSKSEKLEEKGKESSETADASRSQEKEKVAETNLEELYTEVESIAEEILQEDPENSMVKQLAPHLEEVLKNLEGGKLSGLRDSLLHMKLILTDLKERLEGARKDAMLAPAEDVQTSKSGGETSKPDSKKKEDSEPGCSKKMEDEKVPVDEVIPDPVYIAPLGDKEKVSDEKKEKDSSQAMKSKEKAASHSVEKEQKDPSQTIRKEKDSSQSLKSEGKDSSQTLKKEKSSSQTLNKDEKDSAQTLINEGKVSQPSKKDEKVSSKPSKEQVKISSKPSKEEGKASSKTMREEDKASSKPKKEEDKVSSKPVKEGDKAFLELQKEELNKYKDKVPVDEVIPEPVYIKPLGETDKKIPQKTDLPSQKKSQIEEDKLKEIKTEMEESSKKETESETKEKDNTKVKPERTNLPKDKISEESQKKIETDKDETDKDIPKLKVDKKFEETESLKPVEQLEQKQQVPDVLTKEKKETKKTAEQKVSGTEQIISDRDNSQYEKDIREPKEKENVIEKPSSVPKSQDKVPPIVSEDKKNSENISASSTSSVPQSTPSSEPPSKSHTKEVATEREEELEDKLNLATALEKENPLQAIIVYDSLVQEFPKSYQALYRRAQLLDKLSESEQSNIRLEQAIEAYVSLLDLADEGLPKDMLKEAGLRCADRMYFRGRTMYSKKRKILRLLTKYFGDDVTVLKQIGVFYLQIQSSEESKVIFQKVLEISPDEGFALAHYGFILKIESKNNTEIENAIKYLERGINTHEPGVDDRRLYYHLGDALQRLGQNEKAYEIYDEGVKRGMFKNRYQRSTYNVERLISKPIWTPEETTYEKFFQKVQSHWEEISREAVFALELNKDDDPRTGYREEGEDLQEAGLWGIFDLFIRGKKVDENCKAAPVTCSLIEDFPPAAGCKRGQIKFSVMSPGTHIYPHTGPTNCRLRAHLGLVTPEGVRIRIVNETLMWEEGKLFIFDDSYEHEVWHEGKTIRVILIIDVWHPDLTEDEKNSLTAI